MKFFIGLTTLLLFVNRTYSQNAIIIDFGGTWKYWANTQGNAPASSWTTTGFNDAAWPGGPAKLGFGGDGEVTAIPAGCGTLGNPGNCSPKFTTTYFRTTVNIANVNDYLGFAIDMIRDDGAIVYVNGQEVWRSNMPSGSVNYSTFAAVLTEGTAENEVFTSPVIPVSFFQNGNNTIAVEVHQVNASSSDLGMNLRLWGLFSIPANEVIYMWSGAITSTSAKVNAKLTSPTSQARLVASTNVSLSSPIYGSYVPADASHNMMVSLPVAGLTPNTTYYYAVEADGIIDNSADDIGTFKTFGTGAYSYKFTVGGCGLSSNHPVYNKMGEKNPNFFVALGDFHYANPNSGSDINVHRTPYETNMLSQTASRGFFKNVPLAYVWDDHDYAGNDSDSTSAGKTNARLAYQEYVPHYQLAKGSGDVPIYQSFTIGRVHFIMTDLRSTRRQGAVIWDAAQKQWFKDQCLYAKNNNLTIAWVSSVSFGGNQADNWGGFTSDRMEISNFFRDNSIQHMFILSGDAHMLAIDNGANHDFSTGSNNPFDYPVFATAPLNQSSSSKGGNYNVKPDGTVDPAPGANYIYLTANNTEGQYGLVEITDNGVQLCIKFTGYRVNSGGTETQLTTYTFCRVAETPLPIKLTSFTVKTIEQAKVQLDWEVIDQTDCQKYVVEHSEDGINFNTIATVDCHPSNKYSIIQNAGVKQQIFYRLKMMEVDGKFSYSPIRKIGFDTKTGLEISPNPVKNVISFSLRNNNSFAKTNYLIFDMNGKKVAEGTVTINGSSKTTIAIEKLSRGNYLLQLSIQGSRINQQFVVQ